VLEKWDKPFLVAFSDHDPINSFAEPQFRQRIPGAQGFDHPTIRNAGYYVQEDAGEELADIVNHFIAKTS
jgi:haloalkane dehalogenase